MFTDRKRLTNVLIVCAFALCTLVSPTVLAAAPSGTVNSAYDLQIITDWDTPDGATIVPAGETLLLASVWHNGREGTQDQDAWIPASDVVYTWRSGDQELLGSIERTEPWLEPAPDWDSSEQVLGEYAAGETAIIRPGTVSVQCLAQADPPYQLVGSTEAEIPVYIAALQAGESVIDAALGDSITLYAYWTPNESYAEDEAKAFFEEHQAEMGLWDGSLDEWMVTSLVTPFGTEEEGPEALAAAAGPITPSYAPDGFGCAATVTPTQPGIYTFTCSPALGAAPCTTTVTVHPQVRDAQIGECFPGTTQVLVPRQARDRNLTQRFSIEVDPGYDDVGGLVDGTVYWSYAQDGDMNMFLMDDGELVTGEVQDIELNDSVFDGNNDTKIRAWLVPPDTEPNADAVYYYGLRNPEQVREWSLATVPVPAIVTTDGSDLEYDAATNTIFGLTADVEGRNPQEAVLEEFAWNAASVTQILRADGQVLGEDESVGTGNLLSVQYAEAAITGVSAEFVVLGDVTGSGTATITDLVRMARAVLDPSSLTGVYLQAADFTGTGSVGVSDLVREAALIRAAETPVS